MFQYLSALHNSDDGRLQVHLPVLVNGVVRLLDLLRRLLLNGSGDAKLCSLIRVLQVQ